MEKLFGGREGGWKRRITSWKRNLDSSDDASDNGVLPSVNILGTLMVIRSDK